MIAASIVSTHTRHSYRPIGLTDVAVVDPLVVEAQRLMEAAAVRVVVAFEGDRARDVLDMLGLNS